MGTNAGWPEAFGFSVSGGAPVVIRTVEEGGSAQAVGLQPGDVIAELDGEDVQQWSLEQVNPSFSASVLDHWCVCARLQAMSRARSSAKVPPSLVVISRVRQFRLRRDRAGGYGLTVRGDGPVFVRSVDVPSPAREAGLRSGDLLLEVDSHSVRQASKLEALELLRASGDVLALTVITGGLDWSIAAPPPHLSSPSTTSLLSQSRLMRNNTRYQKAATFHNKVNSKNWFTAMGFRRYESERPLIPLQLHYLVMHNNMRDFAEILILYYAGPAGELLPDGRGREEGTSDDTPETVCRVQGCRQSGWLSGHSAGGTHSEETHPCCQVGILCLRIRCFS